MDIDARGSGLGGACYLEVPLGVRLSAQRKLHVSLNDGGTGRSVASRAATL